MRFLAKFILMPILLLIYSCDTDSVSVTPEENFSTNLSLKITNYESVNQRTWFLPINIQEDINLHGVELDFNFDYGKIFQFGIYNYLGQLITSTGIQELSYSGVQFFPLEEIVLQPGKYSIGFTTNSSVPFAFDSEIRSEYSRACQTLPVTKPLSRETNGFPQFTLIKNDQDNHVLSLDEFTEKNYVCVLGQNGNQIWGWNTSTGRMCFSEDEGGSWTDAMLQADKHWGPADLVCEGSHLYILMYDFTLLKTSSLSADAEWTEINPPESSEGALGRPYNLNIWNGYLYVGEYSGNTQLSGGPKIHRMNLSTGEWKVSKQFPKCRHIHAIQSSDENIQYAVIGDAGYGIDVGIHRLERIDLENDGWQKETSNEKIPYPVNIAFLPDGSLLGSGDAPPTHILKKNAIGKIGQFILNPLCFKLSTSDRTETTRSIAIDRNRTAYYFTRETSDPALYVSFPPYYYRYRAHGISSQIIGRTIVSGDYVMNYDKRWRIVSR